MGLGIAVAVGTTPDPELAGAVWVRVNERMGEPTTYSLRYDIDIEEQDFPALADGRLDAGSALAVIAPFASQNVYLVKGPVRGQRVSFAAGGGGSFLEVEGVDTSVAMDYETRAAVWTDVTDSDAVSTIVGRYGYTPDVEDTRPGHFERKHALVQRDTDFGFVRTLARRNGCLFWISADAEGAETAHFKRPVLDGEPAVTLEFNPDNHTIEDLELTWDVDRPTSAAAAQLNVNDTSTIEGDVTASPLRALGTTPLAAVAGGTRSVHMVAPVDDAGDLTARGEATLIESGWFVRATCQTRPEVVGAIVRASTLVKLQGVGKRHSGLYYVAAVSHFIDASEHRMTLELVRNGWGN